MYLTPIPVQPNPTRVDWWELIGTWGTFAILGVSLYFEYQRHKRGTSAWPREG